MVNVGPLLPALVPLATLLWIRAADHSVTISRNTWDHEYDYIVGELLWYECDSNITNISSHQLELGPPVQW